MPHHHMPEASGPWAFARRDGPILGQLTLLPDGRIGGSTHASERRWCMREGLRFLDEEGRISCRFVAGAPLGGEMTGRSTRHGDVVLRALSGHARLPARGVGRRRNLVLLRAGPGSLHPFWPQDMPDEERSWDLCLSWYGDPAQRPEGCEFFHPAAGTKFEGLAAFLAREALAWEYDFVWMPDDDLMVGWADINRMFALCAEYDLMLAQPSLARDCFINHPITAQRRDLVLRFVSFVEIMAPLFSAAGLRLCAPSFSSSRSGYGLDHLWPCLIGAPRSKVAILDAVAVVHTRPIGASYDQRGAMAEGRAIEDAYGLVRRYQVFGTIAAAPEGTVHLRDRRTHAMTVLTGEAARRAFA